MKLDAIDSAINLAKEKTTLVNFASKSTETIKTSSSTDKLTSVSKIKNLPIEKNTELIKKQLEAEYLVKKAEAEELLLTKKDEILEDGKQKLIGLALAKLPSLPKLPIIDPKILQTVAIANQLKDLYKEKRNSSKENLTKGVETYKFPLNIVEFPSIKIPDIPIGKVKLPRTIPSIPGITNSLPNLINAPISVSNITSGSPNFPNLLG